MSDRVEGRSVSLLKVVWDALERFQANEHKTSLSATLLETVVPELRRRGYLVVPMEHRHTGTPLPSNPTLERGVTQVRNPTGR